MAPIRSICRGKPAMRTVRLGKSNDTLTSLRRSRAAWRDGLSGASPAENAMARKWSCADDPQEYAGWKRGVIGASPRLKPVAAARTELPSVTRPCGCDAERQESPSGVPAKRPAHLPRRQASSAGVDGLGALGAKRGERVAQGVYQGGLRAPIREPGEFSVIAITLPHVPILKPFGA
jgi:hypothetical protein